MKLIFMGLGLALAQSPAERDARLGELITAGLLISLLTERKDVRDVYH